jgi:hypothetical protein
MDSYFQATLQGYVNDLSAGLEAVFQVTLVFFQTDVAKIMELYHKKEITAINSIFLKKLLMILIRVIFVQQEIGETWF